MDVEVDLGYLLVVIALILGFITTSVCIAWRSLFKDHSKLYSKSE